MRFGAEYKLNNTDVVGLILFSAPNAAEALLYVDQLIFLWHFDHVSHPKPLPHGAAIDELQRLFPGFLNLRIVKKEKEKE